MFYILFLLIIGANVVYNFRLSRKFGYPPLLFSCLWFFIIFIHYITVLFENFKINELSAGALLIFTSGVVMFTIGGSLVNRTRNHLHLTPSFDHTLAIKKNADLALFIISVCLMPFYVYKSYKLASEFMIMDSLYSGMRYASTQGEDIGLIKYAINFAYASFFVQCYRYFIKKDNKVLLITSSLILVVFCGISTGRTFFLLALCMTLGLFIVFRKVNLKILVVGLLTIGIVFSIVGILLNKGGSVDSTVGENVSTMIESFTIYLIGGASAFDSFLHSAYTPTFGQHSFRFVVGFTNKLGVTTADLNNLVDEYVSVPFETNVYTIYKNYIQDFGLIYMLLVVLCMSVLHTLVFYKALASRHIVYSFIYSLMLYPLVMSFFQEQYFSLMPTWIFLISLMFIVKRYFLISPTKIKNAED